MLFTANSSLNIILKDTGVCNLGIFHLEENSLPAVMRLGPMEKMYLKMLLWFNLIIGGGLRILILRMMKAQGWFIHQPINILIAVDELGKIIGYTAWIQFILMAIDTDLPLVEKIGERYCYVSQYPSTFGVIHGIGGGSSMLFAIS